MKNKTLQKLQEDIRSKFGKTKSGGISKVTKSRKKRRKEARNEKKDRRLAYYAKKHKIPIQKPTQPEKPRKEKVKKKKLPKPKRKEKRKADESPSLPERKHREDYEASPKKKEKSNSKTENAVKAREERELRQLEKQLKMKKKNSLPKAFLDDGLDYLLDVVDKEKLSMLAPDSDIEDDDEEGEADDFSDEENSMDDDEGENDEETVAAKTKIDSKDRPPLPSLLKLKTNKIKSHAEKKKVRFADDMLDNESTVSGVEIALEDIADEKDEDDDDEEITSEDDQNVMDEGEEEIMSEDDFVEEVKENKEESGGVREDIYGRLVDAKGSLLSSGKKFGDASSGSYIPPAKRAAMLQESGPNAVERERLKKQMKGLLNRASESNMQSIAGAVEDLYMNNSRAAVNDTLFALILEACVSDAMMPDRFVAEMTMLVSILHGNVGSEVGSFFLEHLVKKFDAQCQLESYGMGHSVDNLLLLLAYFYNFKVAHHTLMFDIMGRLVEKFGEKDIELILLILKAAGFSLRKDDPAALGQQISAVQKKAQELESSDSDTSSRVKYMLEVLLAVRNNNMRKVPGVDTERIDRLRRLAGSFIRGSGLSDNQLNVGLKDFLQAEEAGRWWLVGSAWDGRTPNKDSNKASPNISSKVSTVVGSVSQKLMDVAKKLRMNSDIRRSIFFVLMSSEDYLDAFQKVLQLGIKGQQEREIVVVAVECCKREATYNPYYSYFLARLASHDRRFMMALQFHMWDMFKTMSEMPQAGRHNLALLLSHLFSSQALPLSILKVLEFGALDKATEKFLQTMLAQLLTSTPTSDIEDIFRRVGQQVKLQHLAEGLRVFLASSVKVKKLDVADKQTLKKHRAVASTELAASVRTVL